MAASFRWMSFLLLMFLQASYPDDSVAQQPSAGSPGTLNLTLKDAVRLALKQNPERIIAQLTVSESDRNSQIARSALLPQAQIEGKAAYSQYNLQSVEAHPPQRAAGPYQDIEAGPSYSQTLVNLRAYWSGQYRHG
jgi:outer membrane protein